MLGPVLERLQTEFHDKVIDRVFAIMSRGKLLPDPPQEIENKPIQVEYQSMLAAAQKAVETAGIERMYQVVGNMVGVNPDIRHKPNWEYSLEKYSALLGNDPRLLVDNDTFKELVEGDRKQQQQAGAIAGAQGAADTAKTLSETDVGGGINAIQAMLGTGQEGGV